MGGAMPRLPPAATAAAVAPLGAASWLPAPHPSPAAAGWPWCTPGPCSWGAAAEGPAAAGGSPSSRRRQCCRACGEPGHRLVSCPSLQPQHVHKLVGHESAELHAALVQGCAGLGTCDEQGHTNWQGEGSCLIRLAACIPWHPLTVQPNNRWASGSHCLKTRACPSLSIFFTSSHRPCKASCQSAWWSTPDGTTALLQQIIPCLPGTPPEAHRFHLPGL